MFLPPPEHVRRQRRGVLVFSQEQPKYRGKELCIRQVERVVRLRGGQRLGDPVAGQVDSAEKTRVEACETERFYGREDLPKKAGVVEARPPGSEMLLDAREGTMQPDCAMALNS